jgi:hypothetical protein
LIDKVAAMPVPRALLVLIGLSVIAGAVVHLRGRSARLSYEIQQLHSRQVELRQELWTQQMELARLRTPEAIRLRLQENAATTTQPDP